MGIHGLTTRISRVGSGEGLTVQETDLPSSPQREWSYPGKRLGRWSSKSHLLPAFTRVASSSELALHGKNLWETNLTPPTPPTLPPRHGREDWGQPALRMRKPQKKKGKPPSFIWSHRSLQIRDNYVCSGILSTCVQKRDLISHKHTSLEHCKHTDWVIKNQQITPCAIIQDLQ